MRAGFLTGAAALAFFEANALRVEKRNNPKVLQLDLIERSPAVLERSLLTSGFISSPIMDLKRELCYMIPLEIGTPPQRTLVVLDTGSSDLVLETYNSNLCAEDLYSPSPCAEFGAYDANISSTYEYINSEFVSSYADGTGGGGDWAYDTIDIGGAILNKTQFGIQYQGDVEVGILGVGYPIIETWSIFGEHQPYPNLPTLLVQQGYIASRAFSLWTNSNMTSSGTLLFGGIDTEKFSGELVTIDLVPSGDDFLPGGVVSYMVHLYSVTGTGTTGKFFPFTGSTHKTKVLLDSGTPIAYLNDTSVQEIWDFVGAVADPWNPDYALIDCSLSTSTKTVDFFFDGALIVVPMSHLVNKLSGTRISCAFGIAKRTNRDDAIIGESILRAMYVVYDMDNNQVSLAQAVSNSRTSNIVQIVASH